MKIKAVLFNFLGTTVKEKDSCVITNCLSWAFTDHGFYFNDEFFNSVKGKDSLVVIKKVLHLFNLPLSLADTIYCSFKNYIQRNVENFISFDDSLIIFSHLIRRGILMGIETGLPREVFDIVFTHLGWSKRAFNYIGFFNEIAKNNYERNTTYDATSIFGIGSSKEILKVGNTVEDVRKGKKAGCLTAVVLSGTQAKNDVIEEKPDFILRSLSDLKMVV
jgi:phosphoglycolate phosphatase-like HAD superfamily hydrolase